MAETSATNQVQRMEQYYKFHSKIYDATRWSFLFGRSGVIVEAGKRYAPKRILEIGCGTGVNLIGLAQQFPEATIYGLDISQTMLQVAQRNLEQKGHGDINLICASYDQPLNLDAPFDLILFSYALSMMNPGWQEAIDAAAKDLAPTGAIAVVDFHGSPMGWFKRWMGVNHVRMDKHLLPYLSDNFGDNAAMVRGAYGGVWQYVMFLGRRA